MANSKGYGADRFPAKSRKEQAERLTVLQQRFVEEYLVDLNASAAVRRAGYAGEDAGTRGSQLMKEPKVRNAIATAMEARAAATNVDATFVLTHLSEILRADFGDIVNEDGSYKPIHSWPKIWRQMLTGLDTEEIWAKVESPKGKQTDHRGERELVGRVLKAKFVDRLRALELAGRHVDVKAFETPAGGETHVHIHANMNTEQLRARAEELTASIHRQLERQSRTEKYAGSGRTAILEHNP